MGRLDDAWDAGAKSRDEEVETLQQALNGCVLALTQAVALAKVHGIPTSIWGEWNTVNTRALTLLSKKVTT